VGSNLTPSMDVCVRLFCVRVVLCVSSGLASFWSPIQEVLPTKIKETKVKRRVSRTPYVPSGSNRNPFNVTNEISRFDILVRVLVHLMIGEISKRNVAHYFSTVKLSKGFIIFQ
jgi:hypothetical protein